ncbi:MarR family winged helix-turn-helix transcriptional regulator [Deinococcus maricopensis]|uniref:Regulatory protein MarR n=1 Tax=Deinococcus maricopensis (strain DSM 21211 / LMG 22137 / NRRL B-23946 / LB-34) TaxID=709986 RepID=E8U4E5_DEIML|nr:MarR family transcriptional regulator [Deinococcus maricopensis]ADV65982.1 regulatory protein MarR [Deinococcus maricopensis DSM 21211]
MPENAALEHATYLALQTLAVRLHDDTEELFKREGLSATQFNVLRILRGAGEHPLTCGEIAARLINRDPDVTRLLDRLEKQGLVERARSTQDRRVLLTRLSPQGRALVDRFDAPLADLHHRQFQHLSTERLHLLLTLLRAASAQGQHP